MVRAPSLPVDGRSTLAVDALYALTVAVVLVRTVSATMFEQVLLGFLLLVTVDAWLTHRFADYPGEGLTGALPGLAADAAIAATLSATALAGLLPLPTYFGLLTLIFVFQGLWDLLTLEVSPLELFRRGNANLVAVYAVFGAAAPAVTSFRVSFVALAAAVFLVRKSFVWWGLYRERQAVA